MSASNFGSDSMEWLDRPAGRSSSSSSSSPGSRKGKRATGSSSDKPARQPQRGLGVAQLEKIRLQSEMTEYYHRPPPGQPPPPPEPPSSSIHGAAAGSPNLDQDAVLLSSSPPPSSSSYHANIHVSLSPYPIHPNLHMMANHGGRGDMRYGGSQSTPIVRSSHNYLGAFNGAAQYYSHPSNGDITLPLFEPDDFICFKGQPDHLNQSVPVDCSPGSMHSSDDPHDVDLELKL